MNLPITITLEGQEVSAEELSFEPIQESWSQYKCSDGAVVKIKLVVSRILRTGRKTALGEPEYFVQSANVINVNRGV